MKKTLLIAAAALAAGVITSQAQVYSQNVVGYANLPAPIGGHSYLQTVPFKMGVSNGANEVYGSTLPNFSSILIWTGNGYHSYVYDPTDPNSVGVGAPVWYESDDATPATIPTLPVAMGYFLIPGGSYTNVFAGAVAVNVGTSNSMSLPIGGHSYLVASAVPYGGSITNGNNSTGGPNLNGLPNFTSLLIWNGNGYNTALYDPTDPNSVGVGAPLWYQGDDATPYVDPATSGNIPNITVGQGFFLIPGASYTWKTGL